MVDLPILLVSCILISLVFSVLALILGVVAIAAIVGFKNSTHKIEWKPLEVSAVNDDPFAETPFDMENPLKRKIKNPFPAEVVKEDEPFVDLDDPNETSHNW